MLKIKKNTGNDTSDTYNIKVLTNKLLAVALDIFSLGESTLALGGVHHAAPVGLSHHEADGPHLLLLLPLLQIGPPYLRISKKIICHKWDSAIVQKTY